MLYEVITPAAGPSLVFMTIPAVFTSMPGGTVFMTIFFVLTAVASVGAILSLLVITSYSIHYTKLYEFIT